MDMNTQLPNVKYHALLMTAAVVSCEAGTEPEAAFRALHEGPPAIDPAELSEAIASTVLARSMGDCVRAGIQGPMGRDWSKPGVTSATSRTTTN
jgi:hypothetical protein